MIKAYNQEWHTQQHAYATLKQTRQSVYIILPLVYKTQSVDLHLNIYNIAYSYRN